MRLICYVLTALAFFVAGTAGLAAADDGRTKDAGLTSSTDTAGVDTVLPVADKRVNLIDSAGIKHVQNEERSGAPEALAKPIAEQMTWGESIARTVRGWFVKADKEPTETDQYIAGMTDEGVMVKGRIVNMDVFVEFLESFFTEPARYDYRKLVTSLLGMDDGSSPRVMPGDLATALNLLRDRPDMEIHAIGLEKALPEVLSSSFQNKVYSLLLKHRVSPEKVMGLLLRVVRATSFGSHRGHTKQLSEEASIRMLGPLYRYIELYRAKYGPERISGTSDKELMAYFFKKAESHGVTFKWKLGGRRA